MGKEKFVDSSLLDKAIVFATKAHKNTERRGKGIPYIVHPMEVASIVASLTDDQEVIAAAILHDTIEDTGVTKKQIERKFGKRVADIVESESDKVIKNKSEGESWKERKEFAIARLKEASIESKMVALGDKLSNMRTIAADFNKIGDKLWSRFHVTDPREHEWHYRGLAESLHDLSKTDPYKEFVALIRDVFSRAGYSSFKFVLDKNHGKVIGSLTLENSLKIEKRITEPGEYILDFSCVPSVNFGGVRTLLRMNDHGIRITITNASDKVLMFFYRTGASGTIKVNGQFRYFTLGKLESSGSGFTSTTYNLKDNDSMLKLYRPFITQDSIYIEKNVASIAMSLGVPTPMSGELLRCNDSYGLTFERVVGKKSYSRLLEANPKKFDEYGKSFAELCLKLHSTECNTKLFPCIQDKYSMALKQMPKISEEDRAYFLKKLNAVKRKTTCIHGDLHVGNVIVTEQGDQLFIDMGDFCYGDPRFDVAMIYLSCCFVPEYRAKAEFHCSKKVLGKFWNSFVKYYIHSDKQADIDAFTEEMILFGAFRMVYISYLKEWDARMINHTISLFEQYKKLNEK